MTEEFQKLFQQMMHQSQEMAKAFNPALESFAPKGLDNMFPTMSKDMLEMWFGKTFNREGLDARTRLLVVLGGLVIMGAAGEPQLKLTIRHALEAGATQREIAEVIYQMSMFGGLPAMTKALEVAQAVFAEAGKSEGDA